MDTKGFEIAFNLRQNMLRVRAWGEWDVELSKKYSMALRDKLFELRTHVEWQIWYVLVDLTRFVAHAEVVQNMISQLTTKTGELKLKKIAYIQNNGKPQLSLEQRQKKFKHACFTSTEKAMEWLLAIED